MSTTIVTPISRGTLSRGFKLTKAFLDSSYCEEAVTILKEGFFDKKILVVTQTSIEQRNGLATVERLTDELAELLDIDNVIDMLKSGRQDELPQVDVLVVNKEKYSDYVVVTFSNTAPVVFAETDDDFAFGTLLKAYVTEDTIHQSKDLMDYAPAYWDMPMVTSHRYPEGTIQETFQKLVGVSELFPIDPSYDPEYFGYGEQDTEFGLLNNVFVAEALA